MEKNDVVIGITADARGVETGVERSKRSLASLGASAKRTSEDLGGMGDGGEKSAKKIERDTRNMQQSLQRYIATLKAGTKESRAYWEQMADFKGVDKNALRPLLSQLDELKRKQQDAAGAAGGLGRALSGLAGAAGAAYALKEVAQQAYETQAALFKASAAAERLKIGLDFASSRGSAAEIAYLRKTTYDLGLQFQSTAQSYMQFQAAAKGTSLEGEKARAVFESVAKATAVMGLSAEQNSGVLLALQQMVSKGTVQAEELRGQLGERLPGAFQIAARSMGVTTAELGKMLEMGQVISEDFLPKFAAELEKSLGDAPEKAANRLDASVNRVNDSWERMKQNVGDSGVSAFWAGQLNILTDAMGNVNNQIEEARRAGEGFGGQIGAALKAYAEFLNPINAISYTALEAGNRLKEAEKRLQELKDAGAQSSSNLMLREAYNHAQRLVDKLREAKVAQDALAGITSSNVPQPLRDREGGNSRGNRVNYEKGLFESAQFLAQRNDGINKAFISDMEGLAKAYANGTLTAKEYASAVNDANKKRYESTDAGKAEAAALREAEKGAKSGQSAYQSLAKSITEKLAAQRQELIYGSKLTDIDKLRIRVEQEMTGARKAGLQAMLDVAKANERELTARAALIEMAEIEKKARQDVADAAEKAASGFADSNKTLREEIELIGLSEEAQHAINQARLQAQITIKEQHLAELQRANDVFGFMSREQIALEEQIRLLKERFGLMDDKKVRDANAKAQDNLEKEWNKTAQTIGDTLADYIMGGGKDAAQYLKRLFATLVLQPVVQTVVGGIMGTGVAAASGAASGGLMDRLSNSAGGFTNWSSWGSSASNLAYDASLKSLEWGMNSTAKSFVSLGNSIQSVDAWLKDIPGMSGGIGSAAGYLGAIYSLSQGNYGSAIGSAIGTWALPGIGTMIGSTLGGLLDGVLSDGARGANHVAGAYSSEGLSDREIASALGFRTSSNKAQDIYKRSNADLDKSVEGLATGLLGVYNSLVGQTGGTQLGINAAFAVNPKYKDENAYGYFQLLDELTGEVVAKYDNRKLSKDSEKAWEQYSAAMAGALVGQLKEQDIPGWMGTVLDSLGDEITLDGFSAALQQIALIDAGFATLASTMTIFADLSEEMETSLLNAAGSIDNLLSVTSSYYNAIYSEQERMTKSAQNINEALAELGIFAERGGIDVLAEGATEKLKQAVEELMAAGNAEVAMQLMAMGQSFAQVAQWGAKAAEDAAKAAQEAVENARNAAYANLEAAVGRERAYWDAISTGAQTAISALSSTLNLLSTNADALYGSVSSTSQMQAAAGMVYIEDALAAVRGGADVSGFDGLSDSISAARSGISSGAYATQFEKDRDALVLAGQLTELGELTDVQLSVQERQLRAAQSQIDQLDQTLDYWQQQVDGTAGVISATLSVGDAVQRLAAALGVSATTGNSAAGGTGTFSHVAGYSDSSSKFYSDVAGFGATYGSDAYYFIPGINDYAAKQQNTEDLAQLLGVSVDEAWAIKGGDEGKGQAYWQAVQQAIDAGAVVNASDSIEEVLRKAGVPGYASGGLHAGGLRIVGERGWEVEATGPSRVWNQQQLATALGGGAGDTGRLERLVEDLTTEVQRLQAIVNDGNKHAQQTAEILDQLTEGGTAMVTESLT